MADFHRSLDRALEGRPRESYWTDEGGEYQAFVEAVYRAIISQDEHSVTFRLNPGPHIVDVGWIDQDWPATVPADTSFVRGWDSILAEMDAERALCEHVLPCEGQE